uniref:Autotransporter domain-containing protein n=1 Tax=uncultured Alphaproteobacteria bacterium TaxID=91750 RepID=A0A6M4NN74_9PROT|nr:hypothetical protein PlAlph_2240 [uncultured Alphaproteobacteria bacterium]
MTRKLYLLASCATLLFSISSNTFAQDFNGKTYSNQTNKNGGALYFDSQDKSTISNSVFENNTATGFGGALYNRGDIMSISDSSFLNNKSLSGGGGAIYNQQFENIDYHGRIASIKNSTFSGNSTTKLGGAIFHMSKYDIEIDSCVFDNNQAKLGGGAFNSGQYNNEGATVYFKNTTFENNFSESAAYGALAGGAIRLDSGMAVFEGTNTFKNNKDSVQNNDINLMTGSILVTKSALLVLDGGIMGNGNTTIEAGAEVRAENTANATTFGNETVNNGKVTIKEGHATQILAQFTNNNTISNNGELNVQKDGNLILNKGIDGKGKTIVNNGGVLTADTSNVTINNLLENNGLIDIQKGKSLTLNEKTVNNKNIDNDGTLTVNNSFILNESISKQGLTNITANGSININNTKSVIENNINNSGKINLADNIILTHKGSLTLNAGSELNMGIKSILYTQEYNAKENSVLNIKIRANKENNTLEHGIINVSGDIAGTTNVILDVINKEFLNNPEDIMSLFVNAPDDNTETAAKFNVSRIIGNPYIWEAKYNAKGNEKGSAWYLSSSGITPEVIAGMGLHEAAIEQTRSVVRNVRNKVAAGREYCPNCGIYSAEWDGQKLRNIWVTAQGETATIDKPVKMDADIWGVEAGFDVQSDVNNTLGVFASYRKGEYDLSGKADKVRSNIGSEIDIDSYLAGLYYRYDKNMNWLFATVYGGIQQADAKTNDGIAKFDTDGVEFGASVEAGHSYELSDNLILEPSLGLYYTQINFDDAKDNVGKEYSWKDIKHLEAELGAKLEKQIDTAKVYIKPSIIQTVTSGDSVKVTGLNKLSTYDDGTLGRIELGGRYGFTDALSAYGWVNYTFGSDYDATAFGLGVNYSW